MNIYSKAGDKGTTNLVHTKNVSKSDDRINLLGTIDELTSHIGLVKTMMSEGKTIEMFEAIQETLLSIMDGVADTYNRKYRITDEKTDALEAEINRIAALFERSDKRVLPGKTRLSAELDIVRTVARRAERSLASVSVKFGADTGAKKYMNRLADYFYVLARYEDSRDSSNSSEKSLEKANDIKANDTDLNNSSNVSGGNAAMETTSQNVNEAVIQEVIRRLGVQAKISLDQAKRLIERIEKEAERRGKKAVIAVCGPDGNPVAVHVMDGAFLVSFDVAVKKAYTSVAVKMSTMELSKLAQPGETFYGVDKLDGGKIVIFGGGIPIKIGETIIGGLGVSGGTGEEDHSLAEYGLSDLSGIL